MKKNVIHGHRHTSTYTSWENMKRRCNNPKDNSYKYYGARGINVCEEWGGKHSFVKFLEDMGVKPDGYELDRIDVNGNYSPENCRWVTREQNARNKRRNIHLQYQGETLTLSEWSRKTGLSISTLHGRIVKRGWTIEDALTKHSNKKLMLNGESLFLSDWCRRYGINRPVVQGRLKRGWKLLNALTTPIDKRHRNSRAKEAHERRNFLAVF